MNKIALAAVLSATFSVTAHAGFINGGFENGNLSGWTGGGGTWYGSPVAPVNPATYNGGPANNTLMSAGFDPITGSGTVYNGSYSVRVNDSSNNYSVSTLRQTVTNYTDNNIYFAWNAVLEASHGLQDSDYFSLTLTDDTLGSTLVSRSYSSAGSIGSGTSGVTWTGYNSNSWFSSGWVTENINVAALGALGHDFTITLLASDCPYGGHAGYAYLDGFSNVVVPPGTVPEPTTLALLGMGLAGLGFKRRRRTS